MRPQLSVPSQSKSHSKLGSNDARPESLSTAAKKKRLRLESGKMQRDYAGRDSRMCTKKKGEQQNSTNLECV